MENKRYQNIFKTAPFGFALREIILDAKGKPCDYIFLDANDKFAEFTGLNIADIIGKKYSELFLKTENDIFDWIGFYGKVALNGGQDKTEQYSKKADKWFKVEVTSSEKLQFAAFFTDVTHKYHLINALKGQAGFADAGTDIDRAPQSTMNTEQQLLSLFEQTNDAVFIIDLDGNYLETNRRASEMFGYSHEEMQTLSVQDISSEPAESQSVVTKLLRGEKIPPYIRHFLRKNDSVFPAEINVQLIYDKTGEPLYIQSVVRDITHRYQEEEFMRTRDALLQKLSQQIPGVIYQYQFYPNGKFSFPYVSENMQELFEISPQEAKKDSSKVFSRMHPDDHQMVMDSILDSYLSLTPWELEYRVVLPEKGTRWLSGMANPEKQIDGSVLWHGYTSDITERKTAEEALQKSEEKFRSLVDSINDVIFTLDKELRYSGVFGNWINTLGLTKETFLEKTPTEILGEEMAQVHNNAALQALKGEVITYEWQMLSGKETAYYQTTLSPIYNKQGVVTGLSGVGRDITSTKRAAELEKEIQLTRNTVEFKQKFLASMSHEIRTPLTGV
ncbi:MAG: PAS domain S-box protein, partial [Bacteroidetes bacterium]